MGGGYYDREMDESAQQNNNNQIQGETQEDYLEELTSKQVGQFYGLDPILNPKNYSEINLTSTVRHPIVFALDVTGSMTDWPKILYDKMPMFYGQIMIQKYLTDPAISFCAIADYFDEVVMQVSTFAKAGSIDEQLTKIHLGGGIGPENECEAYELAGYFYNYMVDLENVELPFFFLTCDEDFYSEIEKFYFEENLGRDVEMEKIKGKKIFSDLKKKYNLFIVKKPLGNQIRENELDKWIDSVSRERILIVNNSKASIDIVLGAIALTNGITIEKYIDDMRTRGQTEERISEVESSLKFYYEALKNGKITVVRYEVEDAEISQKDLKMKEFIEKFKGLTLNSSIEKKYEEFEKISTEFEGKIPEELICPLTKKLILDAVKSPDGNVFEREAIEKWLDLFGTHPITGEKLSSKNLEKDLKTIYDVEEYYLSVKDLI